MPGTLGFDYLKASPFWRPMVGRHALILHGERMPVPAGPHADSYHADRMADVDAVATLQAFLSVLAGTPNRVSRVSAFRSGSLAGRHVFAVGGMEANGLVGRLQNDQTIPFVQGREPSGRYLLRDARTGAAYFPDVEWRRTVGGDVAKGVDVAYLVRVPNPDDPDYTLTVMAGFYGSGTHELVRALTDDRMGSRNLGLLRRSFPKRADGNLPESFGAVFALPIDDSRPVVAPPVTLSESGVIMTTWAGDYVRPVIIPVVARHQTDHRRVTSEADGLSIPVAYIATTGRPKTALRTVLQFAQLGLHVKVVVTKSSDLSRKRLPSNVSVYRIGRQLPWYMELLRRSELICRFPCPTMGDRGVKRTWAGADAYFSGDETVVESDDDHRDIDGESMTALGNGVRKSPVSGARLGGQLDNSLVALALRSIGHQQSTLPAGGLIAYNTRFIEVEPPNVFNEDWIRLATQMRHSPTRVVEQPILASVRSNVLHAPDSTFVEPEFDQWLLNHAKDAKRQELGEILGEGSMAAMHANGPLVLETVDYWSSYVADRRRLLRDGISEAARQGKPGAQKVFMVALNTLEAISAFGVNALPEYMQLVFNDAHYGFRDALDTGTDLPSAELLHGTLLNGERAGGSRLIEV